MENGTRQMPRRVYIYMLIIIMTFVTCYVAFRYEVTPRTAEQSLLAINEAYKRGMYDEVNNLIASHRVVFTNRFHDELVNIEKLAAREKEAANLFADIQRAVNMQQSFEAYNRIEVYLRLYPNCSNGDEVRAMASQFRLMHEQTLNEAVPASLIRDRSRAKPVQLMIVDVKKSNKRLILAVYIPNPNKDKISKAVMQLRAEMPAWEHEILFLNDPDFSINDRKENNDKISATYFSATRTLSLLNLEGVSPEVIIGFP